MNGEPGNHYDNPLVTGPRARYHGGRHGKPTYRNLRPRTPHPNLSMPNLSPCGGAGAFCLEGRCLHRRHGGIGIAPLTGRAGGGTGRGTRTNYGTTSVPIVRSTRRRSRPPVRSIWRSGVAILFDQMSANFVGVLTYGSWRTTRTTASLLKSTGSAAVATHTGIYSPGGRVIARARPLLETRAVSPRQVSGRQDSVAGMGSVRRRLVCRAPRSYGSRAAGTRHGALWHLSPSGVVPHGEPLVVPAQAARLMRSRRRREDAMKTIKVRVGVAYDPITGDWNAVGWAFNTTPEGDSDLIAAARDPFDNDPLFLGFLTGEFEVPELATREVSGEVESVREEE